MSLGRRLVRQVSRKPCSLPLYDFLLPKVAPRTHQKRFTSTTAPRYSAATAPSDARVFDTKKSDSAGKTARKPYKQLSDAQREFLHRAVRKSVILIELPLTCSIQLRVNHAGELAATRIYRAQTPPIVAAHPHLRPLMKHMYDQEAGHFKTFNELLAKHRIRPTAMYPIWEVVSSGLGWVTGVMGREAAMACTEAVETEIGDHYNNQVRVLLDIIGEMEAKGEEVDPELKDLLSNIRRIRDEELEHLDHAVENDAQAAVPHALLNGVIRAGCRGAIWISERV
jgi:ubiquinone biosynthesis monooxygenase Coq7